MSGYKKWDLLLYAPGNRIKIAQISIGAGVWHNACKLSSQPSSLL